MISSLKSQRSGVPLMILAGVILIAELAIILALGARPNFGGTAREAERTTPATDAEPRRSESSEAAQPAVTETPDGSVPDRGEPEEPVPGETVDIETLETDRTHRIRTGETLYALSFRYWDDGRLWPFAFYANRDDLVDPDLLRVGRILSIPNLTDQPVSFARSQDELAAVAHLAAYAAYRQVGESMVTTGIRNRNAPMVRAGRLKQEKSRWVLYAAGWFDPDFPAGHTDAIRPEDLEILRAYQDRFGPPFPDR